MVPRVEQSELYTKNELKAIKLTTELAECLNKVIFNQSTDGDPDYTIKSQDWAEVVIYIHALQKMVIAQGAARMFPDQFRLLGEMLPKEESGEVE